MIRLRPAEPADEWIAWRLRKEIQPALTRSEHKEWWTGAKEHRYIAYESSTPVGIVRITPTDGRGEVHILVASSERGKGFGTEILESIIAYAAALGLSHLYANVDVKNIASQRAFFDAGYQPTRFEVAL